MSARQIAKLIAAPHPAGARLLRGQVTEWDGSGHVVRIAGATLSDLPILASAGTPSVGDVVAVLRDGTSYLILGTITT